MTRVSSWILGVMAVTLALSVDTARATTIYTQSFEGTTLDSGASTTTLPSGWNNASSWGAPSSAPTVYRPTTADFSTAEPLASPADGNNVLKVRSGDFGIGAMGTIQADTDYTLSFAVGWDLLDATAPGWGVNVTAGNGPSILYAAGTAATQGGWNTVTITILHDNPNLMAYIGTTMSPWFTNGGSDTSPIYIDNVRLEASPIPEPSTLLLAATGFVGLVAYAWRKRRQ